MQDHLKLFISADKPDWLTGPDFAVLVSLMVETTPENPKTWLSQDAISKRVGLGKTAVKEALATLATENYIDIDSGKRQNNQNVYAVLYENLPVSAPVRTTISEEATALATIYRDMYLRHCMNYTNSKGRSCRRKLRHDWKKRWSYVAQKLLDAGNTPDFITRQWNWFVQNKPKLFIAGPQGLLASWPKETK